MSRTESHRHLPRHRRTALIAALGVVVLVPLACGDDDDDTATTGSPAVTEPVTSAPDTGAPDTGAPGDDEAALEAATAELLDVCLTRDRVRLRDLSGDGIQDRLRDQDMDRIFGAAVDEITVVERVIEIDGDVATVTVTLEVTVDGVTSELERVWVFERVDGVWVLAEPPDCLLA